MKKLFKKIKEKWGIKNRRQLAVILLIFSIAGLTALYVRKLAFEWLEFNQQTPLWEEAAAWVIFVIPSYHLVLRLYGFILGQYEFIRRFQQEYMQRVRNLWTTLTSKL